MTIFVSKNKKCENCIALYTQYCFTCEHFKGYKVKDDWKDWIAMRDSGAEPLDALGSNFNEESE